MRKRRRQTAPSKQVESFHGRYLRERGINPSIALDHEISSITAARARERGYKPAGAGILFENIDPFTGRHLASPLRLEKPVVIEKNGKKREIKFVIPKNSSADPYFSRAFTREQWRCIATNPKIPLILSEGATRSESAGQRGMPLIALQGVGGALEPGTESTKLRSIFDNIRWKGREVAFVPDGDISTNRSVDRETKSTIALLQARGAKVKRPEIPAITPDGKAGLDDLFAVDGGVEIFKALWAAASDCGATKAEDGSGIKLSLLRADRVEDRPMQFLCQDRIPLRMLTGLCGNPGSCKTWVCLRIAADGSKGIDTFSGKKIPKFNTLYWTNESLPETIRRRHKAMSGDLSKLFILTGAVDAVGQPVSLTLENIAELEQAVMKSKAKLLVVDPLQSFLGAKVNMSQANETRPLLDGLSALADKLNLAVIVIRHLRKDGSGHSSGAALGSIDITAKFRTEYLVGKVPDGSERQVFAHLKFGELQQQSSLELQIVGKNAAGKMVWKKGTIAITAQQLLAPEHTNRPKKTDEAIEYLFKMLRGGPRDAKEIEKERGHISRATLYRAAADIGVRMDGDKKNGKRTWDLPKFAGGGTAAKAADMP